MLNWIASSLIAPWLAIFGQVNDSLQPLELFSWEQSAIFNLPSPTSDLTSEIIAETYLQNLVARGFDSQRQGIWLQSNWTTLASNRGKTPLPAASLTKIATTLATISKFGANHQFATDVYFTGQLENGVVTGDLIIRGTGDPLFVWEEAIALGNALNQLGIREIQGNLSIADKFYMNYEEQSSKAGELLKQGLDRNLWQSEITRQYLQMPGGTAQPEVAIAQVKVIDKVPSDARLLIRHRSLPLAEILRQMNIYSNNQMAQMLADLVGGADRVARISAEIAGFPRTEIELINGSGLGEGNRISPRAVCQMLIAIDRLLESDSLSATDLFPTAGRDIVGTLHDRGLPQGTTIKTGTLDNVSALAGVIPTGDKPNGQAYPLRTTQRHNVYFSIINYGTQVKHFRQQQDKLVNELVQTWELLPPKFNLAEQNNWYLGDPKRNESIKFTTE